MFNIGGMGGMGGSFPIHGIGQMGAMSSMKDQMYELIKTMNGEPKDDGFEISTEKLNKDPNLVKQLRENGGNLPHLHIVGSRNEKDDKALFDLVARHGITTTKKLTLSRMKIDIPADQLKVFPELKEVTFRVCTIENDSILDFNNWCANVDKLTFEGLKLGLPVYNVFAKSENTFPKVKSLSFNFKDSLKMTRGFLNTLSNQFPMVDDLEIVMEANENVSCLESKYNVAYQPLHFKNLKKLFVRAFGTAIDKLFDYMAIGNEKLKTFSFAGIVVSDELVNWIKSCKQLDELTIDWQYPSEHELNDIIGMPLLTKVTLSPRHLDWDPKEIIEFARNNPRLRLLEIDSDRKNDEMKFSKKYKDLFADLIKERGQLTITVFFHEGQREVKISEKGFTQKKRSAPQSEFNPQDFMGRLNQVLKKSADRFEEHLDDGQD